MTLEEFLKNINDLIEENPAILKAKVVTYKDYECKGCIEIIYYPETGFYDEKESDFTSDEDGKTINAICIN